MDIFHRIIIEDIKLFLAIDSQMHFDLNLPKFELPESLIKEQELILGLIDKHNLKMEQIFRAQHGLEPFNGIPTPNFIKHDKE